MYAMLLCTYIFVMFDWIILTVQQSGDNPDSVPMPIVLIDQESDCEATIVQLSFGDRLGALLDMVIWLLETKLCNLQNFQTS